MYQNSQYRVRPVNGSNDIGSSHRKQKQHGLKNKPSINMNNNIIDNNKIDSSHNR